MSNTVAADGAPGQPVSPTPYEDTPTPLRDSMRGIEEDSILSRPRLSRIYYRGTFFEYPLKPVNALLGLGPLEATRIGCSYLRAQIWPSPEEVNFEQ